MTNQPTPLELAIIAGGYAYQHAGASDNIILPPGYVDLTHTFTAAQIGEYGNQGAANGYNGFASSNNPTLGFQAYVIGKLATDEFGITSPNTIAYIVVAIRGTDPSGPAAFNNFGTDALGLQSFFSSKYAKYANEYLTQVEQTASDLYGVPVIEIGHSLAGAVIESHLLVYSSLKGNVFQEFNVQQGVVFNPLSGLWYSKGTFGIATQGDIRPPLDVYISNGDKLANNFFTPPQVIGAERLPNTAIGDYSTYGHYKIMPSVNDGTFGFLPNHTDVISGIALLDRLANGGTLPAADARALEATFRAGGSFRPGTPVPIIGILNQYNASHPAGSYYINQSPYDSLTSGGAVNPFTLGGAVNQGYVPDGTDAGNQGSGMGMIAATGSGAAYYFGPDGYVPPLNLPDLNGIPTFNSGNTGEGGPVVLDLSGNGINITPLSQSNVFFDMANDGHEQHTAWAGAGNGVLVYDPSGGAVTQANQVEFTLWDPAAKSDMQALRDVFDTNHDGVLNSSDSTWNDFRILVTNADGTQTLETLAQAGVTSINLTPNSYNQVFTDGSSINGETTFTRGNGTTGTAATVTFANGRDPTGAGYTARQEVDVTGETAAGTLDGWSHSLAHLRLPPVNVVQRPFQRFAPPFRFSTNIVQILCLFVYSAHGVI